MNMKTWLMKSLLISRTKSRSSKVKKSLREKLKFHSKCSNQLNKQTRRDVLSNHGLMMMMAKRKRILLTMMILTKQCIELMIQEMKMIQGLIFLSQVTRRRRMLDPSKQLVFLTSRSSKRLCKLIRHSLLLIILKKMKNFLMMKLLKVKLNQIRYDTNSIIN